ncbi:MAG: SH3 domain-containing protein [Verrucomicrobia bacterium]|nr:SH3 domain-containing protein [Verrucomicrobiota bacterium]
MIMSIALAQNDPMEQGVVTGDRVNVRARALPTAEICCQLAKGDTVEILEHRLVQVIGTNTEEWVRIVLPNKAQVWFQSNLVDTNGTMTARANGRAGPSLMWPVLCVLSKGDAVNIQTNHADWVGVAPPRSASAWMSGHYVRPASEGGPSVSTTPVTRHK